MSKRSALLGVAVAAFLLVAFAAPAAAITATVRCSPETPGPGEFGSITDAIEAARAAFPLGHTIHVYGHCTETLQIRELGYVQIIGHDGASLTYPPFWTLPIPVLDLDTPRDIWFIDLTIIGRADLAVDLVRIFHTTAIRFRGVTIRGSGGDGVHIENNSTVEFSGSVIEDNASNGVSAGNGSVVNFGDTNPGPHSQVTVQGNGGFGIFAQLNALVFLGGDVSVLNNGYGGVRARGATVNTCCGTAGRRVIAGNGGTGVEVRGGHLSIYGALTVENNNTGLVLQGSYLGNTGGEPVAIRDNRSAGLTATGGSSVFLRFAQIEHNGGRGVLATDASTVMVSDSTIQSNGGEGVVAYALSVAVLLGNNVITGNAGLDLFCTPDSLGRGSKQGIGKIICPTFHLELTPDPSPY